MKQGNLICGGDGVCYRPAALLLLAAVGAVFAPDVSFAADGNGLGVLIQNFTTKQLKSFPPLISAVCYIGGAFLTVSGALKLKAHAEKPDSEKMAPGIARLALGAGLLGLPALMSVMTNTAGFEGSAPTYNALTGNNF